MNIQYLQQLISYYLMMEGEQWAILLYFLHSDNEIKLKQDIIAGLKNYVELEPKNIFLAHRQQKYSAIFKVSQNVGKKILELKEISVGGKTVNVKRYYFDYQLFVNKLPTDFTKEVLISYFSKFGAVKNVVLIPYVKMGINEDYLHCYIKFSQEASVQKVFSVHKLQINNKDFKAFRTYRIGQYEITDKRLQISLKQTSTDLIAFQNQVNQYFQKLGQLRERIRIQNHDGIYSGIITYTSQVHVNNALSKFDASVLTKGKDENISLKQFIYHKEQGGKVYVPSIIRNFDEQYIKKIFESYGQIIDFSTAVNKTGNLYNVTITYAKKSSAKVLIAQYVYNQQIKKLFQGKPHIQFFLNTIDRKNYSKYMNKSKNNVPKQPQFNAFLPQNPHIPNLPNMQNGPFIPQYQGFQPMMNPPFSQGPMIRPNPNIKN